MPLDYRRFNGPEDSVSYKRFTKDFLKSYDELYRELIDANGLRKDGRALEDSRSMDLFFARTDMVSQAKGSSYVELKKTKVVCSVFDPREIPHQNEFSHLGEIYCEVKFSPFSCKGHRRPPAPDADDKSLSVALRQALEPAVCRHFFPNYQIDVFVYIIENDGACLAAAINAAGLALAEAAVPMFDIITASTIAIIEDKMFVDPTEAEEHLAITTPENKNLNHGVITMSTLPELKQIADVIQVGSMNTECVIKAIDILEDECEKLLPNIQQVLVEKVKQDIELQKKLQEEERVREEELNPKLTEQKLLLSKSIQTESNHLFS